MRLLYLLCVLLFVTSSQLLAQLPETEREWSDKTGKFKTTGVLQRIEQRHIFIKTAKKDEVKVPISKLADADRKHIKCLAIYQQERLQYRLVAPHLERYRESPTAVFATLMMRTVIGRSVLSKRLFHRWQGDFSDACFCNNLGLYCFFCSPLYFHFMAA